MPQTKLNVAIFDLDHTLIHTDLLYEQFLIAVKKNPLVIFTIFFILLKGKLALKKYFSEIAPIHAEDLPYNEQVLEKVRQFKKQGISCFLVSASWHTEVSKIANYLGFFNSAFGSNESVNLKGINKLKLIQEQWGHQQWAYVGDSNSDLSIWKKANLAISVNASASTVSKLKSLNNNHEIIHTQKNIFVSFFKAIRIHQWVKNILVFIPIILAHRIFETDLLTKSFLAFILFSFCASSIYLLNDLFDLSADRRHQKKKSRPLASGDFPIPAGIFFFFVFSVASLLTAFTIDEKVGMTLLLYFILNLLYTFKFKSTMILDVILLAVMYNLRILFGGELTHIPISHWLLSFSIFFFLGLAFIKRYSELIKHSESSKKNNRAYVSEDRGMIAMLGVSCSLLSVFVFSMYLSSDSVRILYQKQNNLWALTPILVYWLSRTWLLTYRGQVDDDPVAFAIKDKTTYFVGILSLLVIVSSI